MSPQAVPVSGRSWAPLPSVTRSVSSGTLPDLVDKVVDTHVDTTVRDGLIVGPEHALHLSKRILLDDDKILDTKLCIQPLRSTSC